MATRTVGMGWAEAGLPTTPAVAALDPALRDRLAALFEAGWALSDRFELEVRQLRFHPFVAADYPLVLESLLALRKPGLRFLEWGSGTGVITIMADLLGFDAYGIELDEDLVAKARELARATGSGARFAQGSFLPSGYRWRSRRGEDRDRLGTIGEGRSGYLELGLPLDEFGVVFAYPWTGEELMMRDLMRRYGGADASFLLNSVTDGITTYRGDRVVAHPGPSA